MTGYEPCVTIDRKKLIDWLMLFVVLREMLCALQCFRDEDIDGSSLLQLSESHLRNIIQMKLGPSLHLKKALDDLASFSSNASA